MSTQLPWEEGPSLLQRLRAGGGNAGDVELPTEGRADLAAAGFGPGAIDGVLSSHGVPLARALLTPQERRRRRLARAREQPAPLLVVDLQRLAARSTDAERLAVYRSAQSAALLNSIDKVLHALRDDAGLRVAVLPHARWLIDEGRHHGPVKLGLALLGATADGTDPHDLERLRPFARHPDFGLYGVVAIANLLDDPADELWAIARETAGWRRIHAVRRLALRAAGRPDVQRWLLTEGWKHAILDAYLAHACATGGDLANALDGEVDDELLTASCAIFRALHPGGPAASIRDYADGPAAAAAWLAELQTRCDSLERLESVLTLRSWLLDDRAEDGPDEAWSNRAELIDLCDAIALDPSWIPQVEARFNDGTAQGEWLGWRLSELLGLDRWDSLFDRLVASGPGHASDRLGRLRRAARGARTRERRRALVDWAETTLPLDAIAAQSSNDEPGEELKLAAQALATLLRPEPEWADQLTPALLITALRAPERTLRILAARALQYTPRETWGDGVAEAACDALADDRRDHVRRELRALDLGPGPPPETR